MGKRDYRLVRNFDDAAGEDEPKKSAPVNIHVGKSSAVPWIIGGVIILGGGLLLWKLFSDNDDITDQLEFVITPLQDTVEAGEEVKVSVRVTNIGTDTVSPSLRFDLKQGTGYWTGVNENPSGFISLGDIAANGTVTKELSMEVPGDWNIGTEVWGRVVCDGHRGTVWSEIVATIPMPQAIQVSAVPTEEFVHAGTTTVLNVTFNNPSSNTVKLQIAVDLRKEGIFSTWEPAPSEKDQYQNIDIPAGVSQRKMTTPIIPVNWGFGTKIAARIIGKVLLGSWSMKYIFWGGDDNYVFTIVNAPVVTYPTIYSIGDLTAKSPSNGIISSGSNFSVTFPFTYKWAEGGVVKVCAIIDDGTDNGVWASKLITLPAKSSWYTYSVQVSGKFISSLGSGWNMNLDKVIFSKDEKKLLAKNNDADVFKVA